MTDTEKQFAGNYVRLVNQVRELQGDLQRMTEAFDNSTQLNNKLHDEIILKDKMIEIFNKNLSIEELTDYVGKYNALNSDYIARIAALNTAITNWVLSGYAFWPDPA